METCEICEISVPKEPCGNIYMEEIKCENCDNYDYVCPRCAAAIYARVL